MRFLLLMIMSVNLVFSAPADVCSAGKKQTSFGEISKLISVTSTISNELGGFVDPGPPDVFQVYDFCDQISEEKNAFGYDTEEIFIKYLSEKILGIKSGYAGKVVSDEPYNGYLRKYLHHFQCDTRELTPFSMREKNSFFKHICKSFLKLLINSNPILSLNIL